MSDRPSQSIEHQQVPAAHRGLHDFLYDGEDVHAATADSAAELELQGSIVGLQDWCDRASHAKVAGVYAVLDGDRQVQYVNLSRNVRLSLQSHLEQHGPDTCAYVRVQSFKFPKRAEMERVREAWIAANGSVPSGNAGTETWAATVGEAARAAMSVAERQVHEDKKLKLRKAMADRQLMDEADVSEEGAERMRKLEEAVENDDWSAIIHG
ncbi:GIY-YIG nuclease family protein [Synechococcus sp. PCC 7336]|uniref:GIY-YIG nuclease family protein n=1 Tax=Synechococcus sp. PCC 7336 TaxID=195250 RepID=UPI00034CB028|nr:GIY-YIG nuclease family protein [Synechococcus sp. PCC 7336]